MPAPSEATYADSLKVTAQTATRDALNSGSIQIYTEADVLLAQFTLPNPCGTVSAAGVLTLDDSNISDVTVLADGTATWASFRNSSNVEQLAAPVSVGSSAVAGEVVLTAVALVTGATVSLISATFGA